MAPLGGQSYERFRLLPASAGQAVLGNRVQAAIEHALLTR
jgi:hypothetical protein